MARFDEKTGERLPDDKPAKSPAPPPEQKPKPEPKQGESKPRSGTPGYSGAVEKGGK